MIDKNVSTVEQELAELRARVAQLEAELDTFQPLDRSWTGRYYPTYYAVAGFFLGMAGAVSSLLFNVVGATRTGEHPLQLIRVYLTFGLGERALDLQFNQGDDGLMLIIGCCLYIFTGMLLGVIFQVVLSLLNERATLVRRLYTASILAVIIWLVNYYLILSWLQPLLFGGNWIVTQIPIWVALLTHLVFGWTMAVVYPLGIYEPYRATPESP